MTEVNTFSAAVDDTLIRSGRVDRKADIIAYVRSSIRECQVRDFFKRDLVEDTVSPDLGSGFIWTYPQSFRILRTVRYPLVDLQNRFIYPKEILPGKKQKDEHYFYYAGPGYYVFAGLGQNDTVDVAYYSNSKKLPYYEVGSRPASYELETDSWVYLNSGTPEENKIAQELVSNWILFDYYDIIVEGALAKVFKSVEDPRSKSTFALYKSYQSDLISNEPSDSLNK